MKELELTTRIIECTLSELTDEDRALVAKAVAMTDTAYTPYSKFNVGAAIRLDNGIVVTGSNQENAAFPSGTCAERSACFYAGANFPDNKFNTIAIAARDADSDELISNPISPCGGCRQALLEYEKLAGAAVRVMLASRDKILILPSVKSLLPLAFTDF